jgi:hypothetical protein
VLLTLLGDKYQSLIFIKKFAAREKFTSGCFSSAIAENSFTNKSQKQKIPKYSTNLLEGYFSF